MTTGIVNAVPEGEYLCEISSIQALKDDKNRDLVTWTMNVVGGAHDGAIIEKRFYLVNKAVFEFLRKELKMLGINPKNESDFAAMKTQAYGKRVRITAVINEQGYASYYLKEVVEKKENKVAAGEHKFFGFDADESPL